MILQIKHFPSNNIIAETCEFTASESFMDIKSLAVKIDFPTKLIFTPYNGRSYNYIDYNNNRYYLFIDPTTKDDNKSGKFTYNFNFKGFEYLLKLIPFIDIVKAGGNTTYTNGGIVSFFGGTATIKQFLNASLETYFGNNTTWQVVEDFSDAFEPTMYPDQYFSLINQSCWDAVTSIKDVLGINYFIDTPISGVSKIRITDKTATLPYVFRQGDGDGLYSIGKTISNEEELLTVIRPSGGNRNIRPGYKKDSKPADTSRYSPYLLLPDVNGFLQYEIRKEEAIKKYGIRTKSVSDPFQGIFPSIQNATLGDVYDTPLPVIGNDGISLSGLKSTDRIDRLIGSDFDAESKFLTVYVTDIGFNLEKKENNKYVYYTAEDSVISMRTGLYAGQEFKIQEGKVVQLDSTHSQYANGARYSIVLERNEDGTDIDGKPIYVPTEALIPNDKFAILGIYPPDVYYKIAERRLFNAATEWLNKYSVPQYTIPIDIAVSYFIEHPDEFINFRAGNRLKVWGEDIDVNIESFTIQTYSLQYTKDNPYPKYSVTLSEVKEMGLLDRLNAISKSSTQGQSGEKNNGGSGSGGGGGGIPNIDVTDKRYLRKDVPDVAGGYIDFQEGLNTHKKSIHEEGLQIGKRFVTGYVGGIGGLFDKDANGEIESLKIRTSLEVPTITFNNIDVISGDQVSTFSFGRFKEVDVVNKIATLDLLDDERGTPHINDICRGVFHNIEGSNLDKDTEDDNGFVNYAGFSTAYFTPIDIIESIPGSFKFKYALKAETTVHPMANMNFFGYGNFTDTDRQTITYTTRTYTRRLKKMNTWIINPDRNIAMQEGLLEGLTIGGMVMHGHGTYSENNYFTGTQIQFTPEQDGELAGKDAYSVVLSTYESSIVVDDENSIQELTEQKDVYVGNSQVVTGAKDVVITSYKLNTLIQASKGDKALFYSDVYQEGGYVVSLRPVGCIATINGGIVSVTSILDPKECYVEILVNCEGTVLFEKVFKINVTKNGLSNIIADIDNEMSAVACDQNGKVLFGLPLTTNVSMWYGDEELTVTSVVLTKPTGVTASHVITKGAKISVTAITDAAADKLDVGIAVTANFRNTIFKKELVFTINKVKQGENAVLLELLPSATAIKRSKANVNNPNIISCSLTKTDGSSGVSSVSAIPSGYSMKYSLDGGAETVYSINSAIGIANIISNATFYLYYDNVLIDRETIPVVIDGIDGTSNIFADIDNEMASVSCDVTGKVLFGLPLTTNVSMWYGDEELTVTSLSLEALSGVTASHTINKHGIITITAITDAAADTLNLGINVSAAYKGVTYTRRLIFTINKVKQGENAVLYELLPSSSAIKRNKLNVNSPSSITCALTKKDGKSAISNVTTVPSGYIMKYSLDSAAEVAYTINSTLNISGTSSNVTFYLYFGVILLDKETIPVIFDGIDGLSNIIADIDNEMSAVACDQNGKVLFGLPLTTNVSMWYGDEELTVTSVVLTKPTGVTASHVITKGAKISVTAITDAAADKLDVGIAVTALYDGKSYTKNLIYVLNKVRKGENAVIYELSPSVTAVKRTNNGVSTPTTVMSSLTKTDGSSGVSSVSAIPSGYSMKYSLDGGAETVYSINSAIGIANATKNITFFLYYGTVLSDKETVPIVIDGATGQPGVGYPGEDGTSATRFWLVSTVEQIGVGSAGGLEPSSFLVYSKYQTGSGGIGDEYAYYILLFRTNNKASWSFVTSVRGASMTVTPSASYKYYRICLATAYTTDINSSYIIDTKDASIIENGQTGSMPRYRGIYKGGTTYVWNAEYRDIVNVISGSIYTTYQVATYGQSFSNVTPPNASYWSQANQYDFVAMNTALIEGASIANFQFKSGIMQSQQLTGGVPNLSLNGNTGKLTALNADITGTINANEGVIGAFQFNPSDSGDLIGGNWGGGSGQYMRISRNSIRTRSNNGSGYCAFSLSPYVGSMGGSYPVIDIDNRYHTSEYNDANGIEIRVQGGIIRNYFLRMYTFDTVDMSLRSQHFSNDASWLYRTCITSNRMPSEAQINTISNGKRYQVGWDEGSGMLYIH